jgi:hypothetical protein
MKSKAVSSSKTIEGLEALLDRNRPPKKSVLEGGAEIDHADVPAPGKAQNSLPSLRVWGSRQKWIGHRKCFRWPNGPSLHLDEILAGCRGIVRGTCKTPPCNWSFSPYGSGTSWRLRKAE